MFSNSLYLTTTNTTAPIISWVADSPFIATTAGTWSSTMPITSTTYQWLSSSDNVNWASTPFNTSTQDFFGINNIYVKSIVTVITSIKTLTAESNVINTGNVALRVPTLLLNADIIQLISKDTFLDSSTNNLTINRNGTPTQGSFSPYALNGVAYNPSVHGGSAYFNGSSYLTINGNQVLNFGSSNWTVEMWVNLTRIPTGDANHMELMGCGTYNSSDGLLFMVGNQLSIITNNDTFYRSGVNHGITANTWNHVAYVRNGNVIYFYVNGSQKGSVAFTGSVGTGPNTYIGCETGQMAFVEGYISNLRVVKNTALYTSPFTPSTSPLTNVADTSLLLNFTNGGIIDSTAKNDLTTVGNVKVSTFVKYGAGSLYFDGTGDYLTVPASNNFNFANGTAFTVEFFINPLSLKTGTGNDGFATIISTAKVYPNGWRIEIGPTGIMFYTYSNSAVITTPISLNTWTHIAVVHDGTTTKMYKDGVLSGSAAATWTASTSDLVIGALMSGPYTYYYHGYIDDLRITKGIARYPSQPFPTAALPNTSVGDPNMNDVVLLLQSDLILPVVKDTFLDSSSNNVTITNSASQGSFGPFPVTTSVYDPLINGGSAYFNGIGQMLVVSNSSEYNFGTGDFTIECWVNMKGYGSLYGRTILDTRPNNTNGNYWHFSISTAGKLQVVIGNTSTTSQGVNALTSDSQIQLNTWTHVACTRSSGTVNLYINGNLDKTGSLLGIGGASQLLIGSGAYRSTAPDQYFFGYISDVRIIKGTARTITSAPTSPLTNIANTSFLLNCTNGLIIDSAAKTNVYYKTDSTTISDYNPKYGIGSIYCSTFSDRTIFLSPASGDILGLGTNSFTIECWYKLITVSSMGGGFIFTYSVSGNNNLVLVVSSNRSIGLWLGHANYGTSASGVIPLNTWCHIALVRNGTSVNIYVDGTSVLTATNSSSIGINMIPCINGYGHDSSFGNICYIDDFRISKNCAVYKNNFTPSSIPLTFPASVL